MQMMDHRADDEGCGKSWQPCRSPIKRPLHACNLLHHATRYFSSLLHASCSLASSLQKQKRTSERGTSGPA